MYVIYGRIEENGINYIQITQTYSKHGLFEIVAFFVLRSKVLKQM
jgi:hypothetical protein